MESKKSIKRMVLEGSQQVGLQLLLDILYREQANLDFMKFSKTYMLEWLVIKSTIIRLQDMLYLVLVQKSLLMYFFAHGKPQKLECKLLNQELSQLVQHQPSILLEQMKEQMVCLKDLLHYGLDKFLIQFVNLYFLKSLQKCSTDIY